MLSKESASAGYAGLIPGSGRSPGEGNGSLLWYTGLRNPMDRGALQAIAHEVAKVEHNLVNKSPHHIHIYTYILTHRFILSISFYYRASLIKIVSVLYS